MVALAPAPASAQLAIAATGCEGLDVAAIEDALEVELAEAADALRGGAPVVELSCGDGVRIAIADPLTGKRVERTVPSPTIDRERVLTLAIAQLFLTSWLELLITPSDAPGAGAAEAHARAALEEAGVVPEVAAEPVATEPEPPAEITERAPPEPTEPTSGPVFEGLLGAGARVRLEGENLVTAAITLRAQMLVDRIGIFGLVLGGQWGRTYRTRGAIDVWAADLGVALGARSPSLGPLFVDGVAGVAVGIEALDGRPYRPDVVVGGTTVALVLDGWLEVAPTLRAGPVRVGFPLVLGAVAFAPEAQVSSEAPVITGGVYFSASVRVGLSSEPEAP